jgi:phosphatidylglycerophosphatase C
VATGDPARPTAAFDFDGTLTRRDSLVPFLARLAGWPAVTRAMAPSAAHAALALAGRGDRDAIKGKIFARLLTGRPYEPVQNLGARYGTELARDKIRDVMRQRLQWHRERDHRIVIVSASLAVYLDTVGRILDVDAVLGTELEVDDAGACTGRMLGGNCRGPEKARRLRAYLGDTAGELWVYGDSSGDAEMLAMADHPVRVRAGSQSLPAIPTA